MQLCRGVDDNDPQGIKKGCLCTQVEETAEALKPLTEFLQKTLGERVERVSVSQRLADSPCALVTSKFGWSAYQERIMRSQVGHQTLTRPSIYQPGETMQTSALRW